MESPDISVVVLAYRSASTIEGFVTPLVTSLEEEKIDWEIILVGNYFEGAGDQTPEVVKRISDGNPRIKAVVKVKEGMMGWDRWVMWMRVVDVFLFNDTATTRNYTLALPDALPIDDGDMNDDSNDGDGYSMQAPIYLSHANLDVDNKSGTNNGEIDNNNTDAVNDVYSGQEPLEEGGTKQRGKIGRAHV